MWVPYAALSNTFRALSSVGLDVKNVPQSREKTYLCMGGYSWVQTPRSLVIYGEEPSRLTKSPTCASSFRGPVSCPNCPCLAA